MQGENTLELVTVFSSQSGGRRGKESLVLIGLLPIKEVSWTKGCRYEVVGVGKHVFSLGLYVTLVTMTEDLKNKKYICINWERSKPF